MKEKGVAVRRGVVPKRSMTASLAVEGAEVGVVPVPKSRPFELGRGSEAGTSPRRGPEEKEGRDSIDKRDCFCRELIQEDVGWEEGGRVTESRVEGGREEEVEREGEEEEVGKILSNDAWNWRMSGTEQGGVVAVSGAEKSPKSEPKTEEGG